MSRWTIVLLAGTLGYLFKLAGYLVPTRLVAGRRTSNIVALLPVALLAALTVVQTFAGRGGALTVDARAAGLGAAVVLLLLRANFLVVVIAAAVVAALLRAAGIG